MGILFHTDFARFFEALAALGFFPFSLVQLRAKIKSCLLPYCVVTGSTSGARGMFISLDHLSPFFVFFTTGLFNWTSTCPLCHSPQHNNFSFYYSPSIIYFTPTNTPISPFPNVSSSSSHNKKVTTGGYYYSPSLSLSLLSPSQYLITSDTYIRRNC